ncbi:MAG TPA: hypothetical protein DEO85_05065 [Maritimibacter sp.]|nr:hypothetical protein [Maritimibacter sp.]
MWLKRAFKDTLNGQGQALFVLVVGGIIGLAFLYFTHGRVMALEEVPYFWAAVAGALGALLLLFLWNLACTPYRIQKERADLAESEVVRLEAAGRSISDEVPWYLRQVVSVGQCQVFAVGNDTIQILFPWPLRCTPSICWGEKGVARVDIDTIQIKAWDNRSLALRVRDLGGKTIWEIVKDLKEMNPILDADDGEGIKAAARKLGLRKSEAGDEGVKEATDFIYASLSDPEKGHAYIIRQISDTPH